MPRSTDPPLDPDHAETGPPSGRPPMAGAPRWVKVFAVVALAVAALVVVGLLTGGHGPGRHLGLGHASPLSTAIDLGPG